MFYVSFILSRVNRIRSVIYFLDFAITPISSDFTDQLPVFLVSDLAVSAGAWTPAEMLQSNNVIMSKR